MSEVNVTRNAVQPPAFARLLTCGTGYAQKAAMVRPILAICLPLLVALFASRAARAQTVTINSGGIARLNADGSAAQTSTTNYVNVNKRVNGADCYGPDDKGISYVFPMTVTNGNSSVHVEVWAGTSDCTALTARSGTSPTCWPVSGTMFQALTTVHSVVVRAQDIVSQIASTTKTLTYSAATSTACTSTTQTAALNLYFLPLDAGGNPVGTGQTWDMKVKLVGPAAPTSVSADGIATAVTVSWTQSTDTDMVGYRIFLDSGGTSDGGASTADAALVCTEGGVADGGIDDSGDAVAIPFEGGCTAADSGSGSGGTCSSATLVSGARADQLTPAKTAGKTDTHATIANLTNGTSYVVAVAALDSFDNVGPLSAPVCATPGAVSDFWNQYLAGGGQGGSFRCAAEPGTQERAPVGGWTLVVGAALVLVTWARRRRGGR